MTLSEGSAGAALEIGEALDEVRRATAKVRMLRAIYRIDYGDEATCTCAACAIVREASEKVSG